MNDPTIILNDDDFAALIPLGDNHYADADGNVYAHHGPEIGAASEDFIDADDTEIGRRRGGDDDGNIFQRADNKIRQVRRNRLERVSDRLDNRQDNRDENRARRNDDDDDDDSRSSGRRGNRSGGVWLQHSLTVKFTNATTAEATSTESVTSQSLFIIDTFTTDGSVTGAVMGTAYIGDEPVMNTGGSSTPFAVFANQNDRSKSQLAGREIGPGIQFKATATLPAAGSTSAPVYGFITLLGRRWVPTGCA